MAESNSDSAYSIARKGGFQMDVLIAILNAVIAIANSEKNRDDK